MCRIVESLSGQTMEPIHSGRLKFCTNLMMLCGMSVGQLLEIS